MKLFSPCPRGLESVLASELRHLGAFILYETPGGVGYQAGERPSPQGSQALVYRTNLWSRIASRVLIQLAHHSYQKERDLYDIARSIPWEDIMLASQTIRIDTSATHSPLKSLNFANLLIKDAICDRLREVAGERPSVDTRNPDVRVFMYLDKFSASIYLDSSGENLFKRGWRTGQDKGEAPIKENLAAGLIALSEWQPDQAFADVFCGSGTIVIEAAQIAYEIAPGLQRNFAFQQHAGFDENLWEMQLNEAQSRAKAKLSATRDTHSGKKKKAAVLIQASDIDRQVVQLARDNAQRAGLHDDAIQWSESAAESSRPQGTSPGVLVSNPPYGERIDESFNAVALGNQLRKEYAGWKACFIHSERGFPGQLRLKESRKYPLFNGALECRLFCFQMREKSQDQARHIVEL